MKASIKIFAIVASVCSSLLFAADEPSASSLPINVSADKQSLDGLNKTGVFLDNVLVTQGNIVINADELRVIERNGKGTELFVAKGSPAVFKNTIEGKNVSAQANTITYDVDQRIIVLEGEAEINQDGSLSRGEKIEYQLDEQRLMAEGNPEKSKRVTTIFLPEDKSADKKDPAQ